MMYASTPRCRLRKASVRIALSTLALIAILVPAVSGAGPDNSVEWSGISHIALLDRTPLCPLAGQSFTLRLQSWANDLTTVRVRVEDGGATFVNASLVGNRGPYDVWEAQIPGPAGSTVEFVFELNDGTDTDYLGPNGAPRRLRAGVWCSRSGRRTGPFAMSVVSSTAGALPTR